MTRLLALPSLVVVTAVWGATFVVVKDVTEQAPPMDFLAVRFLLAAGVLALWRPGRLLTLSRRQWANGVVMGLLLGIAYMGQTFGQQYTSASMSGFITGMAVVFTPIIAGLLLRRRIGLSTWAAVTIATAGLGIMTVRGFTIGLGEGLILLGALFFALHVVALSEWSTAGDAYALTIVQLGVVGVLCLILGAPNGLDVPGDRSFWIPVAGLAVIATAGAYLVQTWAQARLSAVVAALALTMEPVFAGVFGVLVDGDEITVRIVLGGALVVIAMAITEIRTTTPARIPETQAEY
ncbi:DMT family transporter [Amycolatopsis decaplanina]|uniref:DMT family permease n=1 Tax=Amycolatopsis decaplanina DSM 44594 TaxID=1284240 RepID=M2X1R2_9PSEU|nr:DMT family transporter [Amycolatopsis decaplanina]EME54961.1 DMT family permease [Amycolatopsis decaplanina DSM 44594]